MWAPVHSEEFGWASASPTEWVFFKLYWELTGSHVGPFLPYGFYTFIFIHRDIPWFDFVLHCECITLRAWSACLLSALACHFPHMHGLYKKANRQNSSIGVVQETTPFGVHAITTSVKMIALRSRQDPSTQGVVWSSDCAVHILVHLHKTLQLKNPRLSHSAHATNFDAHCTLANIFVFYVYITEMTGTHRGTGFPSLVFSAFVLFVLCQGKPRIVSLRLTLQCLTLPWYSAERFEITHQHKR